MARDEPRTIRKLDYQFRSLRNSLLQYGGSFRSAAQRFERLEELYLLYRKRRSDPGALPRLMVECGVIDEATGEVLAALNSLIVREPQDGDGQDIGLPEDALDNDR